MNAEKFLKALERSLCVDDDEDLADFLGVTKRTISNWRKGDKPLTERQVLSALEKCHVSAKKHNIWPIVELYPIKKTPQKNKEFRSPEKGSALDIGQGVVLPGYNDSRTRREIMLGRYMGPKWGQVPNSFGMKLGTQYLI